MANVMINKVVTLMRVCYMFFKMTAPSGLLSLCYEIN